MSSVLEHAFMPLILSLVQRALAKLRFPQATRLGFVDSGLGIAYRWRNWRRFWEPHVQATLECQSNWASSIKSSGPLESLTVLGAGRLIDLNHTQLLEGLQKLTLVDADPLVKPTWEKLAARFPNLRLDSQILDLTGKLALWASELDRLLLSPNSDTKEVRWNGVLTEIFNLPQTRSRLEFSASNFFNLNARAVLSLNLLSQLPIQWQMFVEHRLITAFGQAWTDQRQSQWLKACGPCGLMLVDDHLALLNASGAEHLLLITDLEFIEYRGTKPYRRRSPITPPAVWREIETHSGREFLALGRWEKSPEFEDLPVSWELYSSLHGRDLELLSTLNKSFSAYQLRASKTWTWHIAPLGLAHPEIGYVHRVRAFDFAKRA